MTSAIDNSEAAHVRWLLAGAFSPEPNGRVIKVSRHNFTESLASAMPELTLTVADRLGAADARSFAVRCDGLAAFKLAGLVERVPVLQALLALAQDLGSADPARRPSSEQALEKTIALVGEGRLAEAIRKALAPPVATAGPLPSTAATAATPSAMGAPTGRATTTAGAGGSGDGALDRIFSQVRGGGPAEKSAAAVVGNFVDAMRKTDASGAKAGYNLSTASARTARTILEDAVYNTAADVLRAPALAALEAAWRGVKLIIDETPREPGLEIVLLDTRAPVTARTIEAALAADRAEWPDALFILEPIPDLDELEALAELLASVSIPAMVTVAADVFATALDAAGMRKPDDVVKAMGPAWARFRANELARWVCACANPAVVHTEGQGTTKRTVVASPAFAAAAMLTASYRDTGLFGRVFGPAGGIKTPAVHSVRDGQSEAMLPVERFVPVSMQTDMAAAGVLALGSAKNSDKVVAASWPTMSASPDAVGLPAQIITGRVVRFALWVRDQIPPGAPEQDIKDVFEQAAGVFLFPGINEGAFLDAKVLPDQNGAPGVVHLDVQVRAALAGAPVQLGFDVPLKIQ